MLEYANSLVLKYKSILKLQLKSVSDQLIFNTKVTPGISTDEIDYLTHQEIVRHGACPTPLNYCGFPKSICTSVNEVPINTYSILSLAFHAILTGRLSWHSRQQTVAGWRCYIYRRVPLPWYTHTCLSDLIRFPFSCHFLLILMIVLVNSTAITSAPYSSSSQSSIYNKSTTAIKPYQS